ncbi:Uma2 family endonuclease [Capilliphycus salinus ALCB114379]|uniref:Uma2 family endonuclease n=1 Tax=Capilliphycus salinus TaxID=2768948 RepID=UPI0039A590E9
MMKIDIQKIVVPPGNQVLLKDITWHEFEQILEELGEDRASRLSFSSGVLEIMTPSTEHEKDKEIIGELVRMLLDALDIDFEALGSTTFKSEQMTQAIEADTCFYIQNHQAVIGKNRIDLTVDPPPDIAVEIDITSRTKFENYRLLGVPELWRYTLKGLEINLLQTGEYIQSETSPNFPEIPIVELINRFVEKALTQGRSQAV